MDATLQEIRKAEEKAEQIIKAAEEAAAQLVADAKQEAHGLLEKKKSAFEAQRQKGFVKITTSLDKKRVELLKKGKEKATVLGKKASSKTASAVTYLLKAFEKSIKE